MRRWALVAVWCVTCWLTTSASLTAIAKDLPPKVVELQAQVEQTQDLLDKRDWLELINYIHGPMGMTRLNLVQVAYDAPSSLQETLRSQSREISQILNRMDVSATDYNVAATQKAQNELQTLVDAIARELE